MNVYSDKEIYVGQDYRLRLDFKRDMALAQDIEVHYSKPSGAKGFVVGVVDGRVIRCDVTPSVNNETGNWHFQVFWTEGGKQMISTTAVQEVLPTVKQ